jgi:hypothetical protein
MPTIVNLRQDPFERTPSIRGESLNNMAGGYMNDFYAREFWRFVQVQQKVAELAQTAIDYPPMQSPASFNLQAVKASIALHCNGREWMCGASAGLTCAGGALARLVMFMRIAATQSPAAEQLTQEAAHAARRKQEAALAQGIRPTLRSLESLGKAHALILNACPSTASARITDASRALSPGLARSTQSRSLFADFESLQNINWPVMEEQSCTI